MRNKYIFIGFILAIILISGFIARKYFPVVVTETNTVTTIDDTEIKRLRTELKNVSVENDSLRGLDPIIIRIPGKDSIYVDTLWVALVGLDTLCNITKIDTTTLSGDTVRFTYKSELIVAVMADSTRKEIFTRYIITDSLLNFSLTKQPVNLNSRWQAYIGGKLTIESREKIVNQMVMETLSVNAHLSGSFIIKEKYLINASFKAIGSSTSYGIGVEYRIK